MPSKYTLILSIDKNQKASTSNYSIDIKTSHISAIELKKNKPPRTKTKDLKRGHNKGKWSLSNRDYIWDD